MIKFDLSEWFEEHSRLCSEFTSVLSEFCCEVGFGLVFLLRPAPAGFTLLLDISGFPVLSTALGTYFFSGSGSGTDFFFRGIGDRLFLLVLTWTGGAGSSSIMGSRLVSSGIQDKTPRSDGSLDWDKIYS